MGIPDEAGRRKILQVLARPLRLSGDFDFGAVAKRTPGFVGADLAALVKEAAALAVTRIFRWGTRLLGPMVPGAEQHGLALG